jgi:hypothetical protein
MTGRTPTATITAMRVSARQLTDRIECLPHGSSGRCSHHRLAASVSITDPAAYVNGPRVPCKYWWSGTVNP